MKKSVLALLVAAPLALSLSGCVVKIGDDAGNGHGFSADFEDREYSNRKKISKLVPETSIHAVQKEFGIADFNEVYQKDGENVQVLFYRTQRAHKDGVTSKDECTPLIFKNNVLVSWGDTAFQQL
ncbi:DUF3192 domain-containing protein [Thalassotalea sp. PLHSN55]|uniref:DUF3192 domain-containing protein n=1 Tax=Thalassotalea sp. PLHSN55 TaxID=3435888 RepID=UPI003F872F2F